MLKGLNADCSWLRVPVDTLSRSQSVAAHAGLAANFTHFAKQIRIELPSIVNNMRRKKAAVVLLDKVKSQQNTVQIGEALEERLKNIADGAWPEKTDNTEGDTDAGGDGEVEGDDGEDNEPIRQRRRSEDGVQRLLGKALDVGVHGFVVEFQLCCAASTLVCRCSPARSFVSAWAICCIGRTSLAVNVGRALRANQIKILPLGLST